METRAPSSEASSESVGHRSCRDTALFAMRNSWRACIAVMVATSERLSCQTIVKTAVKRIYLTKHAVSIGYHPDLRSNGASALMSRRN